MKRALAIPVAIAAIAVGTQQLAAYVLNAPWAVNQVPYYINPVNGDVSQQAAIAALQAGADAWSSQSTANQQLVYAGLTSGSSLVNNGKNEVFFRNTSNGSLIASTYWWTDSSGHIIDADIVFYDAGIKFYTGSSGCTGSYAAYIEDPATHEFGHVLGLLHTTDTAATMYPTMVWCSQGWRTLGSDDQAGIEALYPQAAQTQAPSAPANLAASSGGSSVPLVWSDQSSNESGFSIDRSPDGTTFSTVGQVGTNVTTYTDGGVAAGTTYFYRVRAYNSGGYSAYSNVASATASAPPPPPPSGFSLAGAGRKVKGVRYVDLKWSGDSASLLDVFRNGAKIKTVANTGAYTDSVGGKGSGTFQYKVCESGAATCSNVASVTF